MEGIAVLIVILLNALFGFFTEFRAEKSVEALKQMIAKTAKVFRDGKLSEIAAELVVPGDIIVLEEGAVRLRSSGLNIFTELPCDFTMSGEDMISNEEVEIPGDLTCYFVLSDENPPPEVVKTMQVEFDFSYYFVNSQEFEVQPLSD